jgi:lysophospholipase L1-like esterase
MRLIGQIIIVVLITIFLGEATLRIYNHFYPSHIFYDDSYNQYRGKPHSDWFDFKLNSMGFLDVEFDPQRKSGYRILGIGDSFVRGIVPYHYNWLTLLESQLNKANPQQPVEVLNMGIARIGPVEYLPLLVREGLPLKPDMVVVAFFTGNDFPGSKPEKRPLYSYSYIVTLLNYTLKITKKMDTKIIQKGKMVFCDDCPTFDQATFTQYEGERSFIYVEGNRYFLKMFDRAVNWLDRMNAICEKKGIKFVVVILPDEIQVNKKLQADIRSKYHPAVGNDSWKIDQPNRMLTERLTSLGIDTLDLYPYFVQEATRQNLYKPRDTHWNKAGNQLAADILQDYIGKKINVGKYSTKR